MDRKITVPPGCVQVYFGQSLNYVPYQGSDLVPVVIPPAGKKGSQLKRGSGSIDFCKLCVIRKLGDEVTTIRDGSC